MLILIITVIICAILSYIVEYLFKDKVKYASTICTIGTLIHVTGFVIMINRKIDFASEAFLLNYIQYCMLLIFRTIDRLKNK